MIGAARSADAQLAPQVADVDVDDVRPGVVADIPTRLAGSASRESTCAAVAAPDTRAARTRSSRGSPACRRRAHPARSDRSASLSIQLGPRVAEAPSAAELGSVRPVLATENGLTTVVRRLRNRAPRSGPATSPVAVSTITGSAGRCRAAPAAPPMPDSRGSIRSSTTSSTSGSSARASPVSPSVRRPPRAPGREVRARRSRRSRARPQPRGSCGDHWLSHTTFARVYESFLMQLVRTSLSGRSDTPAWR